MYARSSLPHWVVCLFFELSRKRTELHNMVGFEVHLNFQVLPAGQSLVSLLRSSLLPNPASS